MKSLAEMNAQAKQFYTKPAGKARDAEGNPNHNPNNGQFASGGSGNTSKSTSASAFVQKVIEKHGTSKAKIDKMMQENPSPQLHKVIKHLEGHNDPHSQLVKKAAERELDDRANRGA